jgi:hypothetical protein
MLTLTVHQTEGLNQTILECLVQQKNVSPLPFWLMKPGTTVLAIFQRLPALYIQSYWEALRLKDLSFQYIDIIPQAWSIFFLETIQYFPC